MARVLQLCVLCAVVVCASAGWVDLFSNPWTDAPLDVISAVACPNASTCYLAGSNPPPRANAVFNVYVAPVKLGFRNITLANNIGHTDMINVLAVNGANGVGGGYSSTTAPGIVYTNDGVSWSGAPGTSGILGLDIEAISNKEFAFVGLSDPAANQSGVLLSSDAGQTWQTIDWQSNLQLPSGVQARFGSFPSATTWYVSGGAFPGQSSAQNKNIKSVHHDMDFNLSSGRYIRKPKASSFPPINDQGYYAVVAKTTDAGQTWKVQYADSSWFYFNDIDCADEMTCVVVGTGFVPGERNSGGVIQQTSDGGATWNPVVQTGGSFQWVRFTSATEAWAAGAALQDSTYAYAYFYHSTDAGKTWTEAYTVPGVSFVLSMWMVSPQLGFATAVTTNGATTVLQYTP